jgi:hypothetical protein
LPADFAAELVANLCSGGAFACGNHPLGNIIEFHPLLNGLPTIRASLGTTTGRLCDLLIRFPSAFLGSHHELPVLFFGFLKNNFRIAIPSDFFFPPLIKFPIA